MMQEAGTPPKAGLAKKIATIIYWLYIAALVSVFFGQSALSVSYHVPDTNVIVAVFSPLMGLLGFIAVVLAYVARKDGKGTYLESHFRRQTDTFWIALLVSLLSFAVFSYSVGLGVTISLVLFVWLIGRFYTGLKALKAGQPVKN